MPSLHFGTSVMAARILSQVGPGPCRPRLGVRPHARIRSRLPGRALRDRPDGGLALAEGIGGRRRGRAPPAAAGGDDPAARAPGRPMTPAGERDSRARARAGEEPRGPRPRPRARRARAEASGGGRLPGPAPGPRKLFLLVLLFTLIVVAIYVRLPEDHRPRGGGREARQRGLVLDRGRRWRSTSRRSAPTSRCSAASSPGPRATIGPPPARPARLLPDHDGQPGCHARLLGPRAPAVSCSPTGRCARRGCRAGARPAGWSPSSCSPTRLPGRADHVRGPAPDGVLPGNAPVGGTIVPAALAAGLMARVRPDRADPPGLRATDRLVRERLPARRYLQRARQGAGHGRHGVRTAIAYIRHPSRGRSRSVGGGLLGRQHRRALGELRGFGGDVPFAVLVQGFFVGMAANLIPSPAGGVGSVDAGMIGAFDVCSASQRGRLPGRADLPGDRLLAADSAGIVAFFQLRGTVARWGGAQGAADGHCPSHRYTSESKVTNDGDQGHRERRHRREWAGRVHRRALHLARDLEPLVIEGFAWGGLLQQTTDVENYPGYPEGVMGPEMMQDFRDQAERFGTPLHHRRRHQARARARARRAPHRPRGRQRDQDARGDPRHGRRAEEARRAGRGRAGGAWRLLLRHL